MFNFSDNGSTIFKAAVPLLMDFHRVVVFHHFRISRFQVYCLMTNEVLLVGSTPPFPLLNFTRTVVEEERGKVGEVRGGVP